MALSERLLNARLGGDVIDHHTYVIAGDGCLMEGISHEAISLAGHLGLGKLIVLFDDNGISIDGPTSLTVTDDQVARFKASGWNAVAIDGHDPAAISAALATARADSSKPWLIACKTTIGYGAPTKAGKSSTHGEPLGDEEIKGTREKLGWPHAPFDIPEPVLLAWRAIGQRGGKERASWKSRLDKAGPTAAAALAEPAGSTRKTEVAKAIAAAKSAALRRRGQARHPRVVAAGARASGAGAARADRRLRRSHRLQRHAHQAPRARRQGQLRRQLHPLRRARACAWPPP